MTGRLAGQLLLILLIEGYLANQRFDFARGHAAPVGVGAACGLLIQRLEQLLQVLLIGRESQ
jgi:hypothetical protein